MADDKPVGSPSIAAKAEITAAVVKRLCLAESIGRIYSLNHPKGQAAVRAAFDLLTLVLAETGSLAISMAENRILVGGLPVEERNPVVTRFVGAFQQIHVDNLLFTRGLEYDEFERFYRALLQGAKVINAHGGLAALLQEQNVRHVQIQQVNYVVVHEDEQVVRRDAAASAGGPPVPPTPGDGPPVREVLRGGEGPPPAGEQLKELTPAETPGDALLQRIRPLMLQNGVTEQQFLELLAKAKPKPSRPRQPRSPRAPRAAKPIVEGIAERLLAGGVADDHAAPLAIRLGEFFTRELGSRTRELQGDNRRLTDEVRDLNRVLDQLDLAVLVWNQAGVVTFVHHSAVTMLGLVAGRALSAVVHNGLKTLSFPLAEPDETLRALGGLMERDAILLRAVERIITSPNGTPVAALLRRG